MMFPVDDQVPSAQLSGQPIWLSGAILTLLNKIVFPVIWFTVVVEVPFWVLATKGRISIAPGFGFIVLFVLVATVFMAWMTMHLQRVGYRDRNLLVANYWREALIPFDQVATVESVWWYRSRLVRIDFKGNTSFGTFVYYLPKWGPMRALFSKPEEELKQLIWPLFR